MVLHGYSVIRVLLLLEGVVRYAVEIESVRQSQRRSRAPQRKANLSRAIWRPAEVAGVGPIVEGTVRFAVFGIEAGKVGKVVQRAVRSGDRDLLALGAEISAIDGIAEFRQASIALPRAQTYDARECVGAVQNAVWPAEDFHLVYSSRSEITEFNPSSDVVHGNPVEQYFVGVSIPSAHKQIRGSAPRAGLEDLNPRNQAKRLKHVQFRVDCLVGNDRNRCAHLRVRRGSSGRGHHHLLSYRPYLQRQNNVRSFIAADVYVGTLLLRESSRRRAHPVPPGAQRRKDKLTQIIGSGLCERSVIAKEC